MKLVVLMPVFEDWESLSLLLPSLGEALHEKRYDAHLVIVDDGSFIRPPAPLQLGRGFRGGTLLRLRHNLGHQKAICVGLTWIHAHLGGSDVVVMDADGEDDPRDVPRLLEAFEAVDGDKVVFAARLKRSESLAFRAGYFAYRALHRLLVGLPVRVGNFSVLPWWGLRRLVVAEELWSHYAAAVVRGRLPRTEVSTHRARRLRGFSTMRLVPLVAHGLAAISVFADIVSVRILLAVAVSSPAAVAIGIVALSDLSARPLLASSGIAGSALYLATAGFSAVLALGVLVGRRALNFLPERDAPAFVEGAESLEAR